MGDLAVDQVDHALAQIVGGHQEFVHAGELRDAGQDVEHGRHVRGQLLAGREKAEVGVEAGGGGVVVAGAEVGVAPDDLPLLPDDEHRLRVRLQSRDAVDHVHASLAHEASPLYVGRLVEARLEFDDHSHLLPVLRGLDERSDKRRVGAGAVEGLLDRQDMGVFGGLSQKIEYRLEAVVGMLEQDIALADMPEDVGLFVQ